MRVRTFGVAWSLAMACVAQQPDYRQITERWVETGARPIGYTARMLVTAALREVEREALALLGARRGDDPSQRLTVRRRGIDLLLRVMHADEFAEWPERSQELCARAVAHATTEPTFEDSLRGRAIACTALLTGRDERLMWLLEGQVRLRTFRNDKLVKVRPSQSELDGILRYYSWLGGDAAPAFDLLLELYENDALPSNRRQRLQETLCDIALRSDAKIGHRMVAGFAADLIRRRPARARAWVSAFREMLGKHPGALLQPEAQQYLPEMFAVVVARIDEGYDSASDGTVLVWLRDLRGIVDEIKDDKVRVGLLAGVRKVTLPLANSEFGAFKELARTWN